MTSPLYLIHWIWTGGFGRRWSVQASLRRPPESLGELKMPFKMAQDSQRCLKMAPPQEAPPRLPETPTGQPGPRVTTKIFGNTETLSTPGAASKFALNSSRVSRRSGWSSTKPDKEFSLYPYRYTNLREPGYAASVPGAGKAWLRDTGMLAAPAMGAAPAEGPSELSEGRTAMGCGPTATTTAQHTARHGDTARHRALGTARHGAT